MKQLVALCFSILALVTSIAAQSSRVKYNFNSDWKLFVGDPTNAATTNFDDSTWKNITTPHAWNEDDAFRVTIANLSTGIAWYRKHFKVPATTAGKKIFLEFEGIRQGGTFYLNGVKLGLSENGVMAFGFDITSLVVQGKSNVVAARIDNSWTYQEVSTGTKFQWDDINFYANYGGINKNVFMHVTDMLHQTLPLYSNLQTTGVYVYPQNINISTKSANITAEAQVRNEYTTSMTFSYGVVIQDPSGNTIATLPGSTATLMANETRVISASSVVSGLNFWSWGYGYLYDVYTTLSVNGTAIDTVRTRTGFRKTNFAHGMLTLNDRTIHLKGYGQRTTNEWPALGCSVPPWMSEYSNKLVLDSHGALIRWMHVTPWKQDVESMDRLGVMHSMPAGDSEGDSSGRQWNQRVELMRDAIIYNKNNPSIIFYESGNHGISEAHMTQMKSLRDTYDPHGGRAAGSREMLDSLVAEYGGEMLYVDKSAHIPFWQMEYSRDEGMRKYWDNYSPPYHIDGAGTGDGPEYNRNQDTHAVENVNRWFDYYEMRAGTGVRVNGGGANIIFSDSNTHHRGNETYRRSGEVDAMRLPKDAWYVHQVMWNTWVDLEVLALHIIGHWNYAAGTVKNVFIASTADKVELLVNGVSLGYGVQSARFLFTFKNVKYQAGTLQAVGYSTTLNQSSITVNKTTTGAAVGIRLTPIVGPAGFRATGGDIAMFEVEVIDAQGQRNPIALNLIQFNLTGEATWRGGIAQGGSGNYVNYILSTSLPVENGVNRVLIRSTTNAGPVTLVATSSGLQSASVSLVSVPFLSTDGLSLEMPDKNMTASYSRGPTPPGASYVITRQAITITSSTAGSNASAAMLSYDDNEVSQWTSTSTAGAAWVKYTLARQANVNQVVMKMQSFHTKTYPLKISVDSKVVFTGSTATCLGFQTLSFNATTGSTVTIALSTNSGSLGIIEAEIYEPIQ